MTQVMLGTTQDIAMRFEHLAQPVGADKVDSRLAVPLIDTSSAALSQRVTGFAAFAIRGD